MIKSPSFLLPLLTRPPCVPLWGGMVGDRR